MSTELLEALRNRGETEQLEQRLAELSHERLADSLRSDRRKNAFWINLYSAEAQILSERRPLLRRLKIIYVAPGVRVAGRRMSLQRLESNMLRRKTIFGTHKPHWLTGSWERRVRVEDVDPRVHFALNCAAESCPPIRSYTPGDIDEQLEVATRSYLESEVVVEGQVAEVPRLFKWYSGDFGGTDGVLDFLDGYGFRAERIEFKSWDWSISTREFA
jgi:hypothetical protein